MKKRDFESKRKKLELNSTNSEPNYSGIKLPRKGGKWSGKKKCGKVLNLASKRRSDPPK